MKRAILVIWCLLAAGAAGAHTHPDSVSVGGIVFTCGGDMVEVSFAVSAGRRAAPERGVLILTPVLAAGEARLELNPVAVLGRGAGAVWSRYVLARGKKAPERNMRTVKGGSETEYAETVVYQEWMRGADLTFEGRVLSCGDMLDAGTRLMAAGVMRPREMTLTEYVRVEVPVAGPSTAGLLSVRFPFIMTGDPDREMLEKLDRTEYNMNDHAYLAPLIERDRDKSLKVHFRQGSHDIDADFADNNESLVRLISAVRDIENSSDSRVVRVVIAGYASPEGTRELNEPLALKRAVRLKDFLAEKSPIAPGKIVVFNGGEDWRGLREMVAASDMEHRGQVLEIIDSVPVWDPAQQTGRRGQLMKLRGGEPYRYIYKNFFPKLRSAAYIKVYYEDK